MATHVSASIVQAFGAGFDIDALLRDDAEVLGESIFREDVRKIKREQEEKQREH